MNEMARSRPSLSVVVACNEARRTIDGCLAALERSCAGLSAEILVAHASDAALAERVRSSYPHVALVELASSALAPELWAAGYRASRGGVVAFTTGHMMVGDSWARALLDRLSAGFTGAGGAIQLGPGAGIVDWAVHYLRYSAFLPPPPAGEVMEIPGDNASYIRNSLDAHAATFSAGFWEVDFHRRIRAQGGRLAFAPEATASFGPSFSFGTILRHRFRHGRHFGAYRRRTAGVRWRSVAGAPAVPGLLLARIARRVAGRAGDRWRACAAAPLLLVLGIAWAGGEAVGALLGEGGSR
jgi:hypothetical protein